MAELSCGEGGSTGYEIITQINENTEFIASRNLFEAIKEVDVLDIPETYIAVARLTIPDMGPGIYVVHISATYQFDKTNKSVFTRFALNGGTAEEFRREPKDKTDREAFYYAFPYTHENISEFDLVLDMRKEDTEGTLDCFFVNLWIEKKAEYVAP